METGAVLANLILGIAYSFYWVMVIVDLKRGRITKGLQTEYAYAWLFMAATCGTSHLIHAEHLWSAGQGSIIDVVMTGIAIPFGLLWFILQFQGMFLNRAGDYMYRKNWITSALLVGCGLSFFIVGGYMGATIDQIQYIPLVFVLNIIIFALYSITAIIMWRSQIQHHAENFIWSTSGVCLATVLWTCGFLHLIAMGWLVTIGTYSNDIHMTMIAALSIPPAYYFLRIWRKMYKLQTNNVS